MMKNARLLILLILLLLGGSTLAADLVESQVKQVIAGDIYKLKYQGTIVPARLIGVNLPKEKKKKTADADYFYNPELAGKAKILAIQKLLAGQNVYLEFDRARRDRDGYLLVYLWLDKEATEMFNEILLREGYGRLKVVRPNIRYEKRLTEASQEAEKMGRGIWETTERSIRRN
ncbi:MAG: thermonuclease family protein [Candidatus Omnitrophica bacterium]|nr:thermonuclease family protein [Candidatus Omnitrophota bacterium]MCM8770209.1 thermonuclease family protein [Candidatus Omnitrophota bacterium]